MRPGAPPPAPSATKAVARFGVRPAGPLPRLAVLRLAPAAALVRRLAPAAALALCLAPGTALAAPAEGAEAVLARGAEALGRGAPREALELYEAYADGGGLHPDVSYSRGVAYLARARAGDDRPGDLGRAAAAFEETLALRPGDADAAHALEATRSAVAHRRARGGKAIEIDAGPGAWAALVGLASEQTWALLAAAGSLSLSAGLVAWFRARARQARLGGALASALGALALALGAAFSLTARQARTRGERGVVIVPELRLTNEASLPLPGSPSLPEAAGVDVAERRGALVRVRWGKVEGWAPATSVKRLPRGDGGALPHRARGGVIWLANVPAVRSLTADRNNRTPLDVSGRREVAVRHVSDRYIIPLPRRRHDSLSKDLLSLWLAPLGQVESPRRVQGEERQIDLLFTPRPSAHAPSGYRRYVGLLGQMARGVAALEVFRNACNDHEVRSCVVKLAELHAGLLRRARREGKRAADVALPHLWALTPTGNAALLRRFRAQPRSDLPAGFFGLAPGFGTTLVVAAGLPPTPETLWLRLLGRDRVQRQAFDELGRLPDDHPLRHETMVRVLHWSAEASQEPQPSEADQELIMNSARFVAQWEQRLLREGKAEGMAEGLRRAVVALCEAFDIALSPARKARLASMNAEELDALLHALKTQRRWPRRGER
ncbi:MAG TPA: hypothetical protein VFS00_07415 [Polyangiaceae bacterium]|nr:hypothetical protein [Polyangiaceae bacterium]